MKTNPARLQSRNTRLLKIFWKPN